MYIYIYLYIYIHSFMKTISASMIIYVYLLEGNVFTLNTSDEKVFAAPQKASKPKSD